MPAPLLSREQLLTRLAETFSRYGYEGTSMSRIATATGLDKASLYHHFPSGKQQMAEAVILSTRAWFDANVFKALEAVHPPRQRLVTMLDTLGKHYQQGMVACIPGLFALTEDRELFATPIKDFYLRWVSCLTQVAIDAGLAYDIASRRAHSGVERIQGALVLSRSFDDPRTFTAMAAELPDLLLAGGDRSNIWSTRAPRFPSAPAPLQARPLRA